MATAALETETSFIPSEFKCEGCGQILAASEGETSCTNSSCIKNAKPPVENTSVDDDLVSVPEVIRYIAPPDAEQESTLAHKHFSFFRRLMSGNMYHSGKKKCTNIIMSIAGGSHNIGHRFIQKVYSRIISELPMTIPEACKIALKSLEDCNFGILVQEKWLSETTHLLQDEILTIGVFGRHKAGKSTVLNALLHQETLPSAVKNETAFITSIYHEPCDHQGKSCFQECEASLSMRRTDIKGRRNIRNTIRQKNTDIRERTTDIQENKEITVEIGEVNAHVPFLCGFHTGNIKIVLLDTPGLAESNELGISELSEHQLMTCSAFIYVISCLQLEDAIDTDTLKAIAERDPSVFTEKRLLIVVTRLDEYKESEKKCNDKSVHNQDSDDEDTASLDELIDSIRKTVQEQCKDFIEIPDEYIIPISATGALEARKVKLGKKSTEIGLLKQKFQRFQGEITTEELECFSQVPLLEEKLGEIALNAYHLWQYSIVRDCSRYLEQAVRELIDVEKAFGCAEEDYHAKITDKEKLETKFKEAGKDLISKYKHGSTFHRSLESGYDEDVKLLYIKINWQCLIKFERFQSMIKGKNKPTSEEYKTEAEKFLDEANESLRNELKHVPFKKVNDTIKESTFELGVARLNMEQCLAMYCNTTTSVTRHSFLSGSGDMSDVLSDEPVSTAPLELKDLLKKSNAVNYSIFDKMKILAHKLTGDDPRRPLLVKERDALLKQLKDCLIEDSKEYFKRIKPKIVESYLQEHKKIAEDHVSDVKQLYHDQKKQVDSEVKEWRKNEQFYGAIKKLYTALSQNLTKQKSNLTRLYAAKFQ